ncbi:male sterility protein-domain-containing protein [Polychytrium aggregatum]|uniref:male sterility protein-domain-containing protein n=1 Tax=Polychytrium aggregatum TaxID=110093 RepID=UPI0022FE8721|nr:male sterility protein-domain-containing protein [Polychytrium aggregatum]KAI9209212.1 male sterility protein-domain-containing protein [Polychytrium aggregatum]
MVVSTHDSDDMLGIEVQPIESMEEDAEMVEVSAVEPEPVQPEPALPADPFDPWVHPVEAFIRMARDEPDALCINTYESGESVRYSYRDVWKHAYSIAQALKALPGWNDDGHDAVGTFCEGEAHWVFFSLAVWMLGKKTLNFGLNWPSAVRKAICARHSVKYILHHYTKPGRTEGVTLVDGGTFPIHSEVPAPSLELCEPLDDIVAIQCTSGTTGIPKSFKFAHTGATTGRVALRMLKSSVGLLQAPSFAATLSIVLGALNLGGSLWIPGPTINAVHKAKGITESLNDGVNYVFMAPSLMKMVFNTAKSRNPNAKWMEAKRVALGSEIVPMSVLHRTRIYFPNAHLISGYGSSEVPFLLVSLYHHSVGRSLNIIIYQTGAVGSLSYVHIPANIPIPEKLVYKLAKPGVRCLLFDEEGNIVDQNVSKSGILVFAVDPDHPVRNHPDFVNADPNDRLASFGFLSDGSPRVCTMDWVEMVSENEFTVVGRFDQKIKVNGVYVDLNHLEALVVQHLSHTIADCAFVQTSEKKIVMLYVLQARPTTRTEPSDIIRMTQDLLALVNVSKVPIHNCFQLDEIPMIENGKRDLKKIKWIAENNDLHQGSVVYPRLAPSEAPLFCIAAAISSLGSQLLGIPSLDGRNYSISGAGFDSLSVGRLALAIKEEYDVEISPMMLLSNGLTPLDVAQLVIDLQGNHPLMPPTVDLDQEAARLDDASVTAEGLPPLVFPESPRGIVLTGATGFLGSFLLYELAAKYPAARIYCLVRAASDQAAIDRIFETARKLILNPQQTHYLVNNVKPRLVGVCGDLSLDQWGLTNKRWKKISKETDMVVHCGAEVHWLDDYEALKGPNVLGTATALRLATTHHLKPLHFISAVGAIPMARGARTPLEERVYSNWNVSGGYAQTKWVSEQLINKARSRGVPATIIRPSLIASDSVYGSDSLDVIWQCGVVVWWWWWRCSSSSQLTLTLTLTLTLSVCHSDDYIWQYIKGCIRIGIAPSNATPVTITMNPVDHVAKVVAAIAASEVALPKFVFHISDPECSVVTETKLFEIVNAYGWPVMFETRERFKALLYRPSLPNGSSMLTLMHLILSMSFLVDNTNTRSIYPALGSQAGRIAGRGLLYLTHIGYLPPPPNPPSPLRPEEHPRPNIFRPDTHN